MAKKFIFTGSLALALLACTLIFFGVSKDATAVEGCPDYDVWLYDDGEDCWILGHFCLETCAHVNGWRLYYRPDSLHGWSWVNVGKRSIPHNCESPCEFYDAEGPADCAKVSYEWELRCGDTIEASDTAYYRE